MDRDLLPLRLVRERWWKQAELSKKSSSYFLLLRRASQAHILQPKTSLDMISRNNNTNKPREKRELIVNEAPKNKIKLKTGFFFVFMREMNFEKYAEVVRTQKFFLHLIEFLCGVFGCFWFFYIWGKRKKKKFLRIFIEEISSLFLNLNFPHVINFSYFLSKQKFKIEAFRKYFCGTSKFIF